MLNLAIIRIIHDNISLLKCIACMKFILLCNSIFISF